MQSRSFRLPLGCGAFSLLIGIALSVLPACQQPPLRQTTGHERFFIPRDELPVLKKRALRGDDAALQRVLGYYLFIEPRSPEAAKWIHVAKSRGVYRET